MLRKTIIYAVFFSIALTSVFMDTAFAIRKEDARRASEILKPRMVIRKYCAPCGDSTWRHITIKKVRVKKKGYDYRIFINGREENLSYFYIKIHGNWVNIAMLIGMEVEDVPEFLPAQAMTP